MGHARRVLITGALLATLEAGCSAPVAAYAELAEGDDGEEIYLRGAVISPDGSRDVRLSRTGTPADAEEIGKALAAELLDLGADSILGPVARPGQGTQQLGSAK